MLLKKILASNAAQRHADREAELYRALIRREAKIGGEIFGPVPAGTRREFFCLDEHTWIWHEEWLDVRGQRQIRTTRYDVRPSGILKAQDGQSYQRISKAEAVRLREAVHRYNDRIRKELYAAYL
ncbi:MAG: hypothetical protein WAQ57_01290 [Candidatus Saccharimonadales bacterium]